MPDKVFALEGNGSRPSHFGDGYSEAEISYTLNHVEQHGVCYGIDQQGGKGGANYTENVAPTMASDSHGTPHAVCFGADIRNGKLNEEINGTLQAKDNGGWNANTNQVICYGIGSYDSNSWKSSNPHSGVYLAETARTLDAIQCGNPACNQGGTLIVECSDNESV